jgi:DNA-directed RNA polymerase specialized sigma24 family protein
LPSAEERSSGAGKAWFATTHWSVVLKARSADEAECRDALAILCQAYWTPVFSYIRHRGHDPETARDLTQGFFASLLERGGIAEARRERGRFRSFLLTTVKHFLVNEHEHRSAQKRGGGQTPISIDANAWETALAVPEPATHMTPEVLFEKQWTLALLDRAVLDMEKEAERTGGLERFRKLSGFLVSDDDPPYKQLALEMSMTESAVRVALHRMRRRFGATLREHVSQTVEDPDKVEEELRYLINLMSLIRRWIATFTAVVGHRAGRGSCDRCPKYWSSGRWKERTMPACMLELALSGPGRSSSTGSVPTDPVASGDGGMGVVYRARDSRLDRDVAIRFCPTPWRTSGADRGFQRSARGRSLNHPNIAAVYGFEDEEVRCVMELVEGATLAERLQSGAMPIDETLALVAQIAEGLEAAHENGIVHRDLKPANIKITPEGKAKILDFGLAKALEERGTNPNIEKSQTLSAQHTTPGMIFGTIPYMSPEQARGRPVDKRSDIWSLGCVLYELFSGRRAFDGEAVTDVLAKILERDPDWDALPTRTPPRVRELLERCLEKDLNQRERDSGDVRIELQRALSAREWTTTGALRVRSWRPRSAVPSALPWAVAAIAVAVAAAAWVLPRRDAPAKSQQGVPRAFPCAWT